MLQEQPLLGFNRHSGRASLRPDSPNGYILAIPAARSILERHEDFIYGYIIATR